MTDPVPLTGRQANQLITALRHGRDLDDAATELGIDLRAVWARARTDTRLVTPSRNAAVPCAPTTFASWPSASPRAGRS